MIRRLRGVIFRGEGYVLVIPVYNSIIYTNIDTQFGKGNLRTFLKSVDKLNEIFHASLQRPLQRAANLGKFLSRCSGNIPAAALQWFPTRDRRDYEGLNI